MCNLSHIKFIRGFTLVELVITIVLIGILSAVGSTMISDSFTTTRIVNNNQGSAGQARYAIERIAREIRETKYDLSAKTYAINPTSATNLVFTKSNDVTVTINYSGTDLTLGYSSPAVTSSLSNQVSSFNAVYYDISNTITNSQSAIRFVQIELTFRDPISGQSIDQRTRVALRNGI